MGPVPSPTYGWMLAFAAAAAFQILVPGKKNFPLRRRTEEKEHFLGCRQFLLDSQKWRRREQNCKKGGRDAGARETALVID